ncbi:phage portal protein, partial [Pseudomonas syringae pv. tagetis]
YNPVRPGQGRGITRFAPVIARVRDLMLYEDAELARKNLEARLGVIVSGDIDSMSNADDDGPSQLGSDRDQVTDLGPLPSGGVTH